MRFEFISGTPPTVECDSLIYCSHHPKKIMAMELHTVKMLKFPMKIDGETTMSHAIDVWMQCPYCGYLELFGIALSRDQWESVYGKGVESN